VPRLLLRARACVPHGARAAAGAGRLQARPLADTWLEAVADGDCRTLVTRRRPRCNYHSLRQDSPWHTLRHWVLWGSEDGENKEG
jgi:hypothetical protein